MKLTHIILDPKYDSYHLLFIDDKIYDRGDEYHDKIGAKIRGIQEFLEFTNADHTFEVLSFQTKKGDFFDYDYEWKKGECLEVYLKRVKKFAKEVK